MVPLKAKLRILNFFVLVNEESARVFKQGMV